MNIQRLNSNKLAALCLSAACASLPLSSLAAGQANQHSFAASNSSHFSFEAHASDYTSSSWTPDNEIVIDADKINTLWHLGQGQDKDKKHSAKQKDQHADTNKWHYETLISDKSFGIEASFKF